MTSNKNNEKGKELRRIGDVVLKAAARNEIYQIESFPPMYDFPLLCEELQRRGWAQKVPMNDVPKMCLNRECSELNISYAADLLRDVSPSFVYASGTSRKDKYKNYPKCSYLVPRCPVDVEEPQLPPLIRMLQNLPRLDYISQNRFVLPCCYLIKDPSARRAFIRDFRLTICRGFLYTLSTFCHLECVFDCEGTQTTDCINYAYAKVKDAMQMMCCENYQQCVDSSSQPNYKDAFRSILMDMEKVSILDCECSAADYAALIKCLMTEARKFFPNMKYEGHHNIWLVRPAQAETANRNKLFNDEKQILDFIDSQKGDEEWIVQKYIERPLLVRNTRFDFRQYFMITMDEEHMHLWMYKNNYFRFADQEFTLQDLSIHIHMTNSGLDESQVSLLKSKPNASNSWTLNDFLNYLYRIGSFEMWKNRVYPGLVDCVTIISESILDDVQYATNHFQLFSADFYITDDFTPVLIDINAHVDLRILDLASKLVNANVVRDMLKVVLDFPNDNLCSTGDFEQIWQVRKEDYGDTPDFKLDNNKLVFTYNKTAALKILEERQNEIEQLIQQSLNGPKIPCINPPIRETPANAARKLLNELALKKKNLSHAKDLSRCEIEKMRKYNPTSSEGHQIVLSAPIKTEIPTVVFKSGDPKKNKEPVLIRKSKTLLMPPQKIRSILKVEKESGRRISKITWKEGLPSEINLTKRKSPPKKGKKESSSKRTNHRPTKSDSTLASAKHSAGESGPANLFALKIEDYALSPPMKKEPQNTSAKSPVGATSKGNFSCTSPVPPSASAVNRYLPKFPPGHNKYAMGLLSKAMKNKTNKLSNLTNCGAELAAQKVQKKCEDVDRLLNKQN